MCLINITALRLTHLNKMLNQKFTIVFADTPSFIQALIRIECKLLLGGLQVFRFLLKHISKSSLLTRGQLILYLFDIRDAALARIAPFRVIFTPEKLFLFIVQSFLLLQIRVLYFLACLQQFSIAFMLKQVVLHVAPKETLKQLTLLCHECACSRDHLTQVLVHCVLVLAARHPIKLTQRLDEFVHGKHRSGQCLTLIIDVFGAFYYLVV